MSDCIFCGIEAGEAPASLVHRDELVSAFLDIRPITPGHLLVIPNDHVVFMHDLPDATADRLFGVARHLARTMRSTDAVRADGIDLFAADGEAAGQEVPHAHLHVIPRFAGDGFVIDAAAWLESPPVRGALDELAARIAAAAGPTPAGGGSRITIAPNLSVRGGTQAVEFYTAAFGAVEVSRVRVREGAIVAEMSIDGAPFVVADESPVHGNLSPESLGGTSVRIDLFVPDPDAVQARAIATGAREIFPVADQDFGYRMGRVIDPFGHHWVIARPLEG